jgi:uncharacterized membrane protein (UPF0127 family)
MRLSVFVLLAVAALGIAPAPAPFSSTAVRALEAEAAATEKLVVSTTNGPHTLDVEVARDEASRERGLMYRRHLPENRGMLFDFGQPQPVMMWMKNTYIPLDMIFIARDGRVTHIEANTEPFSEAIISSHGPAFAVLEVNAGLAGKLGLKPGDFVQHPMFAR